MKLFNIMNGFKVLSSQWAAIRRASLKNVVIAVMMVLSLSAGAVYGQTTAMVSVTNTDYAAETITVTCTDDSYTLYYTTNGSDPTNEDWQVGESGVISVAGLSATEIKVCAIDDDNVIQSNVLSVPIQRYEAPANISFSYSQLTGPQISFTYDNTDEGNPVVRYAVNELPTATGSTASSPLSVSQYYATYNFRVFGSSKFPSENVEVRTNRYNPPAILNYVPYTAASSTDNEIPASGTFVMDNGSTVYINYSHTSSGSSELMDPDPSNTNTYDTTIEAGQTFPTGFHAQNFKMVVGSSSATSLMFPSTVVTVDENYSGYYVVQYGEGTARRYLSLDSTDMRIYGKQVFDRSCLWQPDAQGRLGQPLGSTTYYLSANNSEISATTGTSISWYFNTVEQALLRRSDYSGVVFMSNGDRWALTSGTTSAQLYTVSKRHSTSGTVDMITSFTLDAIQYNGQSPTWIAIADGSYTLSVKPNVTVTTYRLPAHDHYSYTDQTNQAVDFTYFPLYNRSYSDHFQLPFSSEVGSNSNVYADNIEVQWTVENESAAALAHTQPQLSTTSNGTMLSSISLSRNGAITAPQTAQVMVTAT